MRRLHRRSIPADIATLRSRRKCRFAGLSGSTRPRCSRRRTCRRRINVFSVDLEADSRARRATASGFATPPCSAFFPDTISIKIVEREPVGLARIRGEIYQFDADAELLDHDPRHRREFPILDGLRPKDSAGNLKKVDLYLRIWRICTARTNSPKFISTMSMKYPSCRLSEPMLVNLGTDDFRGRWVHYLQLRTQIQEQYPEAVQVDLRFKNQVILKMKQTLLTNEKVIWDAEKKSL